MKDDQVFEVGERTILKMQNQPFLSEEFGTIATDPGHAAIPVPTATEIEPSIDLARKVATLAETVQALQRRLDSIDAVVARLVNR